jgi:hypothetical protein
MATYAVRLQELIGSSYTTIASNSYSDIFNAAVAEVADMLPSDLMVKYAAGPVTLDHNTPTWASVEGKKVLQVLRLDGSGGKYRAVRPLSNWDFDKAQDSNGIYLATKYSPVMHYFNASGTTSVIVFPTPTASEVVKIWYFQYPTSDITGETSLDGLPNEAEHLLLLKAGNKMLQTYISNMVQDDEDSELFQMLTAQQQSLQAQMLDELKRFTEPQTKPRAE